jgi:hypothetical protein
MRKRPTQKPEIEVATPAMIEAGAGIICSEALEIATAPSESLYERVAASVFEAMCLARR